MHACTHTYIAIARRERERERGEAGEGRGGRVSCYIFVFCAVCIFSCVFFSYYVFFFFNLTLPYLTFGSRVGPASIHSLKNTDFSLSVDVRMRMRE